MGIDRYNDPFSKSPILGVACLFQSQQLTAKAMKTAKLSDLMQFLHSIQSRLVSLLMGFLFLCTAVLGALLMGTQRLLAWLDGQHPQLALPLQQAARWLKQHPKTISLSLASLLLAGVAAPLPLPIWDRTLPTNLLSPSHSPYRSLPSKNRLSPST